MKTENLTEEQAFVKALEEQDSQTQKIRWFLFAYEHKLISKQELDRLHQLRKLRNAIDHRMYIPTANECEKCFRQTEYTLRKELGL